MAKLILIALLAVAGEEAAFSFLLLVAMCLSLRLNTKLICPSK